MTRILSCSLKAKKPPGFHSPELFIKVMNILDQHHFRLPALRFVIDLFDRELLRRIVLDEEDDDNDVDTTIKETQRSSPARRDYTKER